MQPVFSPASQTPSRVDRAAPLTSILVVRLGSMGDVIHALPAVAVLRHTFPDVTIGWAVEERWSELLAARGARCGPRSQQKPLVDTVHVVNTLSWRSAPLSAGTWKEALSTIGELRAERYDVAVDFQGAIKSAVVAQLSGAERKIGFSHTRETPASLFYTQRVSARRRHVVEQNLELAAALVGAAAAVMSFELPRDPAAEQACDGELQHRGLQEFAILNPGAGWGAKCWPAERYAEVARALGQDGIRSVANFGPGEEPLAKAVESASGGAAQALSCPLGELIALTRRARLFVGGDTGPMHLAAALRVPLVALFGPTDPVRNGPFEPKDDARATPPRSVVLRSASSTTSHARRAQTEEGLLTITSEDVISAARRLLQEAAARG